MVTKHADVLILGGGSGGMDLTRFLQIHFKRQNIQKQITLIDNKDHFVFVPLLHEVAAGSISPKYSSVAFNKIVSAPHTHVRATVLSIDPKRKQVVTTEGVFSYEYCVIGLGSQTNYFQVTGASDFTHNIRSREDAEKLHAVLSEKVKENKDLTINIIGGGFTGIEIAGELAYNLRKYKRKQIHLVHASEALPPTMPETLRKKAKKRLEKLGVTLILNARAIEVTKTEVILNTGQTLKNDITIWSTGFECTADKLLPESAETERGRIPVNQFLLTEFKNVYAIGDISLFANPGEDLPIPQLAEAAWHQAIYIAKHLSKSIQGKEIRPFQFHSHGSLLPIGNWYAVATIGPVAFSGRVAWIIRQIAYVLFFPTISGRLQLIKAWVRHT